MKIQNGHRKHFFRLNKQERIDSALDKATNAWLQAASKAGHKPAKARWKRRAKRRGDSLPGIVTEPAAPIKPYTSSDPPWNE